MGYESQQARNGRKSKRKRQDGGRHDDAGDGHSDVVAVGADAGASSTPFLNKLWQMLANSVHVNVIYWDEGGDSFTISSPEQLSKHVLLSYFKHDKYSSFQRQLNYFGFKKLGGKPNNGQNSYFHPLFSHNRPGDLGRIRRKTNISALRELDERGLDAYGNPKGVGAAKVKETVSYEPDYSRPRSSSSSRRTCSKPPLKTRVSEVKPEDEQDEVETEVEQQEAGRGMRLDDDCVKSEVSGGRELVVPTTSVPPRLHVSLPRRGVSVAPGSVQATPGFLGLGSGAARAATCSPASSEEELRFSPRPHDLTPSAYDGAAGGGLLSHRTRGHRGHAATHPAQAPQTSQAPQVSQAPQGIQPRPALNYQRSSLSISLGHEVPGGAAPRPQTSQGVAGGGGGEGSGGRPLAGSHGGSLSQRLEGADKSQSMSQRLSMGAGRDTPPLPPGSSSGGLASRLGIPHAPGLGDRLGMLPLSRSSSGMLRQYCNDPELPVMTPIAGLDEQSFSPATHEYEQPKYSWDNAVA
jgi:hypothetical protein